MMSEKEMTYAKIQFERKQVHKVLSSKKGGAHKAIKQRVQKKDERRLKED
jgi:hypothetical protein